MHFLFNKNVCLLKRVSGKRHIEMLGYKNAYNNKQENSHKTVEGNCLFSGQWSMVNQLTIRGVYGQLIDHKQRLWSIN